MSLTRGTFRNVRLFFKVLRQLGLGGALHTVMRKVGEKLFLRFAVPTNLGDYQSQAVMNEILVFENTNWYSRIATTLPLQPQFCVIIAVDENAVPYLVRSITKLLAQIYPPCEIRIWGTPVALSAISKILSTLEFGQFQGRILRSNGSDSLADWIQQASRESSADFIVVQSASSEMTLDGLSQFAVAVNANPTAQSLTGRAQRISQDSLTYSQSSGTLTAKRRTDIFSRQASVSIDSVVIQSRAELDLWKEIELGGEPNLKSRSADLAAPMER